MDKGNQPKKEMGIFDQFRAGLIKSFKVPVLGKKEKRKKRGLYKDHGRVGSSQKIWSHHNEMLMHIKRIKRRRRRTELAKVSRRINRR